MRPLLVDRYPEDMRPSVHAAAAILAAVDPDGTLWARLLSDHPDIERLQHAARNRDYAAVCEIARHPSAE